MADDDRASSPPATALAAPTSSAAATTTTSAPDVALLGGPTENGGIHILRMRDGQVELGELRTLEHGKPILGESVRLHPRDDRPGLFDVETLARGPLARRPPQQMQPPQPTSVALAATRKGPAKIATEAYRSGWESIFRGSGGGKPSGGDLPN